MKRVRIRELPNRFQYGRSAYWGTEGKVGIVDETRSRNYQGIFKVAVKFDDIDTPASTYGLFYYPEHYVEYIDHVEIDNSLLINLLER